MRISFIDLLRTLSEGNADVPVRTHQTAQDWCP